MSPRTAFELLMSVAYAGAGAALLFTHLLDNVISRYREAVGGVLLGYGLIRLYLWWRKRRTADHP